jgi:hypothetical protein
VGDGAEHGGDVAPDTEREHALQRHAELPQHGWRIEGSRGHERDGDQPWEHPRRPHQSLARHDLRVRFGPFQQCLGVGARLGRARPSARQQRNGAVRRCRGQREGLEALAQLELGRESAHGVLPRAALGERDALGEKAREGAPAVAGVGDVDELEQRARPE